MEIIPEHNYPIKVSDTNEIATKDSWKNLPIDNSKQIQIYLEFNESQFSKIKNGLFIMKKDPFISIDHGQVLEYIRLKSQKNLQVISLENFGLKEILKNIQIQMMSKIESL